MERVVLLIPDIVVRDKVTSDLLLSGVNARKEEGWPLPALAVRGQGVWGIVLGVLSLYAAALRRQEEVIFIRETE